jgi:acetolactate synthase small subunit
MAIWFTVQLTDQPGSLARLAGALAEKGINITGIVGVAEDTDGTLMLTTSDPEGTRRVLAAIAQSFEEHGADASAAPGLPDLRRGLAERGLDVQR